LIGKSERYPTAARPRAAPAAKECAAGAIN
jgi:hypothetical protein